MQYTSVEIIQVRYKWFRQLWRCSRCTPWLHLHKEIISLFLCQHVCVIMTHK